jgi:hypothetical protein
MTPPPLSPAAQAVLDAYQDAPIIGGPHGGDALGIAAAIRALVEQTLPREDKPPNYRQTQTSIADRLEIACKCLQRQETRAELLAVAAELDGGTTPTETP